MAGKKKKESPDPKKSENTNELKVKLNEVQTLLDLWDEIKTNPDGSVNEAVDAQIKIISYGEEIIHALSPDLSVPERRTIIEKLETVIKEKYQQREQGEEQSYYEFVCSIPENQHLREELQKLIQNWIKSR